MRCRLHTVARRLGCMRAALGDAANSSHRASSHIVGSVPYRKWCNRSRTQYSTGTEGTCSDGRGGSGVLLYHMPQLLDTLLINLRFRHRGTSPCLLLTWDLVNFGYCGWGTSVLVDVLCFISPSSVSPSALAESSRVSPGYSAVLGFCCGRVAFLVAGLVRPALVSIDQRDIGHWLEMRGNESCAGVTGLPSPRSRWVEAKGSSTTMVFRARPRARQRQTIKPAKRIADRRADVTESPMTIVVRDMWDYVPAVAFFI